MKLLVLDIGNTIVPVGGIQAIVHAIIAEQHIIGELISMSLNICAK